MVKTADPLSFCGGYKIDVEGVQNEDRSGCYGGGGGSCVSSEVILRPGEKHVDRILLNRSYDLRRPGRFSIHVHHELPYGPENSYISQLAIPGGALETFDAHLEIVLESSNEAKLKADYQEYVQNLQSSDFPRQLEAAQVIVSLAPPFLENRIVQMLDSGRWRQLAVRGLHNLGTQSAHETLVAFVRNSAPPQAYGAYQEAIRYIGEAGDRSDLTMLLETAQSSPPNSDSQELAMEAAGKLGGDDAVPLLAAYLNAPSIDTRQSAVRALYLTGSRKAVPVLMELLRSPEKRVSGTAEFGLRTLTHRFPRELNSGASPAPTYPKWARWWNTHRETATIFKYDQCGEQLPLE